MGMPSLEMANERVLTIFFHCLCCAHTKSDQIIYSEMCPRWWDTTSSVGVINGWFLVPMCICQLSYGMHILYTIPLLREWKVWLSEGSSDVKMTICDGHKCRHQQIDRRAKQGLSNSTAPNIFLHVQVECSQAALCLYVIPSFCRSWVFSITRTK